MTGVLEPPRVLPRNVRVIVMPVWLLVWVYIRKIFERSYMPTIKIVLGDYDIGEKCKENKKGEEESHGECDGKQIKNEVARSIYYSPSGKWAGKASG